MYFFIIAAAAWFIAQTMKVVLESIVAKRIMISRYFGDGGYPSCHSAFVSAGLTACLIKFNWNNIFVPNTESMVLSLFCIFFVVVTRDAVGARLQQGQTAEAVNKIMDYFKENIDDNIFKIFPMLKQQQGHFPHQVVAGDVTGIIAAISLDFIIYQGNPLLAIISASFGLMLVIAIGLLINSKKSKAK